MALTRWYLIREFIGAKGQETKEGVEVAVKSQLLHIEKK